jgi:hypothetical protein
LIAILKKLPKDLPVRFDGGQGLIGVLGAGVIIKGWTAYPDEECIEILDYNCDEV